MKVTIDTHKDSEDDIRRVVAILSEMVAKKQVKSESSFVFEGKSAEKLDTISDVEIISKEIFPEESSHKHIPKEKDPKIELY